MASLRKDAPVYRFRPPPAPPRPQRKRLARWAAGQGWRWASPAPALAEWAPAGPWSRVLDEAVERALEAVALAAGAHPAELRWFAAEDDVALERQRHAANAALPAAAPATLRGH